MPSDKIGQVFMSVVANLSPKEITELIALLDRVKS